MKNNEIKEIKKNIPEELNDAQLESVSGGVEEYEIRVIDTIEAKPCDREEETKWRPPRHEGFCEGEVISKPSDEDSDLIKQGN